MSLQFRFQFREQEVALASSILTLMPQKLSEPQQLNELKRLAAGDPRPVLEIFDELASNASTSLKTAPHFPTWEQARNTMYYSRSKRYPRLPARRHDLRLTAEQTTTKSGAQFLMYHSPTNDILIFATEDGVKLLAQSNCWCGDGTFKIVPCWYQQLFTLHVFLRGKLLPVGKTETVVRQIDDGYMHGRGSVSRSPAYGVQQRRVAALTVHACLLLILFIVGYC
ncbi:conserved hypothetical protein [Trichinella spiralis]|uniref:hypothetical protein n=1 Tax=Trichinella spiralis TaxID=6334 RepID=UPI0001EFCD85|nr:conserved hypothetical protein [Trichinella spiralis]